MTQEIPEKVRALLRERITSYDLLEILMFLHAHREEAWSKRSLSERVHRPLDHLPEALEALVHQGLLTRDADLHAPLYRYAAAEPALHEAVEELAGLLAERRPAIMSLMSAQAIERVRSKAPRAFAEAFLFRRKKPPVEH
jgi:hypothetical protein